MSTASLADKYITRSGAAPALEDVEIRVPQTSVWLPAERQEFVELKPVAIYVAISEFAVSGAEHDDSGEVIRVWGGARGIKLARLGVTKAAPWQDRLTVVHARSPVPIVIAGRLWTTDFSAVSRLEQMAEMVIAADAAAPEVNGYAALPHNANGSDIVRRVQGLARIHGVQVVETDAELHDTCRRMAAKAG